MQAALADARGNRIRKRTPTAQSSSTAGALVQGGGGGAVAGVVPQKTKTVRALAGHSAASAGIGTQYAMQNLLSTASNKTKGPINRAPIPTRKNSDAPATVSAATLSRGYGKAKASLLKAPSGKVSANVLR